MTEPTSQTILPVLPARKIVLMPGAVMSIEVGRSRSLRAVDAAENAHILVVPQRDPATADPNGADLHEVGVLAEILQVNRHAPRRRTLVVRGLERLRVAEWLRERPHLVARVAPVATVVPEDAETAAAKAAQLKALLIAILTEAADDPARIRAEVEEVDDADDLVDLAAAHVELGRDDLIDLLRETDVMTRVRRVLPALKRLGEVLQVKANIRNEVIEEAADARREEVLRERMRAIKAELGEEDDDADLDEYLARIAKSKMPAEVREVARKQVARMRQAGVVSPEHSVARTYLEWLLDVPWGVFTEDRIDVAGARAILDADHAGLDKVKKRIVEFIAVHKLAPNRKGPILCLVGPPGVGKTSLGRSIATALGRKYVRISLGGIRDDAEVRGHRRTYIGALPGRITSGLVKAGSMNPVFVLDELDKMASSMQGDPASAMLEVLDPEQNREFVDHYLEVPLDLSRVLFIATANQLETIPPALMDRLEIIRVPSYTEGEKRVIAKEHLLPKQMGEHGLERDRLGVDDDALDEIISHYTREAGVRNLERELAALCRAAAVEIAGGKDRTRITSDRVEEILGPPRFFSEIAGEGPRVGVATGLAWTPLGGDILFIETRLMPGRGQLKLTGQVGEVMSESARAALSYLRANADRLGIDTARVAASDIHLHVPAGAVRKDGPSAGLAITVALASLLSDRPIRSDTAISGEITLRGLVLPVGGIKEKVLAAHRAGIRRIVLGERNEKDLAEVPVEILGDLDIQLVRRIEEALAIALEGKPTPVQYAIPPATSTGAGAAPAPPS